jgi:magnesium transporter
MNATVFDVKKGVFQVSVDELPQRLPSDGFFWIDIDGASGQELQLVATALHLSEPTSSWLPRFGQRARLETDKQQIRISTWGVGASGLPIEVHVLFTRSWLLTVHSGSGSSMDRARGILRNIVETSEAQHSGLFIILTELMASFDPLIEHLDELLYALEGQVIQAPTEAQIEQLVKLRKQLWLLHRIWEPQQRTAKQSSFSLKRLLGVSDRAADLVRDYAERISDLMDRIDDLRQRATESMESYGTSVSNRQSQVINRLTIISAVFLPMTFLTNFYGMNFHWMIDRLQSLKAFLFLGVGLLGAMLVATLLLFWSLGWLGEKQAKKIKAVATVSTVFRPQASGAENGRTSDSPPAQPG